MIVAPRLRLFLFGLLLAIFLPSWAGGQTPGTLDSTFQTGSSIDSLVMAIVPAGGGKVYIGGGFSAVHGAARKGVARLNADGSVDPTFNPGTGATGGYVSAIAVQADGKLMIAGNFTSVNGTARNQIARLNSNGTLDTSFNPGTGPSYTVNAVAVQADGKILIGGDFTSYSGTARAHLARLNSTGSLDTSFVVGTGTEARVNSIIVRDSGKILIGGEFISYNGSKAVGIAQINSNGSFDFAPPISYQNSVNAFTLQADGQILAAGKFYITWPSDFRRLFRSTSTGSEGSYIGPSTGANGEIWAISVQADGKMLIGGDFTSYNGTPRNRIARLNSDGSLDTTFNPGAGADSRVQVIVQDTDGSILIGGYFSSYQGTPRTHFARLLANGGLDPAFQVNTGATDNVNVVAAQVDGKVVIGGAFTGYNDVARNRLARLEADGSVDLSFNPGTGPNQEVIALAIGGDGKMIIAGNFTSYNGATRNRIARINSDGSLDPSFDPGVGPNNLVTCVALQADGKIVIGGSFTTYSGTARGFLARINANGSLDTAFNPSLSLDGKVNCLALQPDGRILVGGDFSIYSGRAWNGVLRLQSSGTLDYSFTDGPAEGTSINAIVLQPDGKFLLAGQYALQGSGGFVYDLGRYYSNGRGDETFRGLSGPDNKVLSMALQADGKLLIGGLFTTFWGTSRSRIARLLSDGNVDLSFDPGSGTNSEVRTLAVQADGKVLAGGAFSVYNGAAGSYLVRVANGEAPQVLAAPDATRIVWSRGGTGPELAGASFEVSTDAGTNWTPLGNGTRSTTGTEWQLANLSLPAAGWLRARGRAPEGQWLVEQVATYDANAQTLLAPAGGTLTGAPVAVSFSLPVAAVPGSLKLSFGANILTLASAQESAGPHSFSFVPSNPTANAEIASGNAIPDGTYAVTLSYQAAPASLPANDTTAGVIIDTTAPKFGTLSNLTREATAPEGAMVNFPTITATDAVTANPTITFSQNSGTVFPLGSTQVFVTARDAVNNSTTRSFFVTVQDTTAPYIGHYNVVVEATGADGATVNYDPATVIDDVTPNPAITYSKDSGTVFPVGVTTVLVTAKDASNNTRTYNFKVTVQDTTGPSITPPADIVAEATGPNGAIVNFDPPTVSDVVTANPVITYSKNSGTLFSPGLTVVTITAKDAANNSSTTTFNVTVQDRTGPMIAAHADVTAEAEGPDGAVVNFSSGTATDLVSGNVAVTYSQNSGTAFPLGDTVVTMSAKDALNNSSTRTFTVTVQDTTKPEIAVHANVLAEAEGPDGAVVHFDPATANDLVTANPVITYSQNSGTLFSLDQTQVTITARDTANNTSTRTFIVTVEDTTAPVVHVPENIVATATSAAGAVVNFSVSADDLVDGAVTATANPASGSTFPFGTTTVTVTATDHANKTGTATFTVTVQKSGDAALASLSVAGAELVPAFDPTRTSGYTVTVGNAMNSVAISAVPAFPDATLVQTPAGNPVTLTQGPNTVQIVVTAQDGTTTRTYELNIRRTVEDNIKPVVKIAAPGGKMGAGAFTASGTVAETVGLARLTVKLNDEPAVAAPLPSDSGAAIPWSVAGLVPENGPNVLTVTATDYNGNVATAKKTFTSSSDAFAGRAGVYNALLEPLGTPGAAAIGLVTVTVTRTGSFTAKVKLPGVAKGLSGILSYDGAARFKVKAALVPSVPLGAPGSFSFGVTEAEGLVGSTDLAQFAGKIAPFSSKNKVPAPPEETFLNLPAANPMRGLYTARIFQPGPAAGTPPGFGYVSVKLTNTGSLSVAGSLPDGTKLSAASKLRADGSAPIFALLYGAKGGFGADLNLAAGAPELAGEKIVWVRPGKATDPFFPDGWETGLDLEVAGGHWPGADGPPLDLGQAPSDPVAGNATLEFTEGGLSGSLFKPVDLNPETGKVTLVLPAGETAKGYTFKANATTGLFSGTVTIEGKANAYQGAFIRLPSGALGAGFFLNKSAAQTGGVVFQP